MSTKAKLLLLLAILSAVFIGAITVLFYFSDCSWVGRANDRSHLRTEKPCASFPRHSQAGYRWIDLGTENRSTWRKSINFKIPVSSPLADSNISQAEESGTSPSTRIDDGVHVSKVGYVMTMHYVDQLTASSANFLSLLCFVRHHLPNVKVVEPFLLSGGTILGVSLSSTFHIRNDRHPKNANTVKLSDLFDISKVKNYGPVVSWSNFMNDHPRQLILVHHMWTKGAKCYLKEMIKATKEFVAENDFKIVRNICLNFEETGVLSPQELIDTIYGTSYNPTDVVVVFYYWGGIVDYVQRYRFSVKGTLCQRGHSAVHLTHHSKRISNNIKEYTNRYMSGSRYIAVMIRFEHYGINRRLSKMSSDTQRTTLMECFKTISSKVESLKREKNIKDTLLAMDFSRQGSCALWGKDNPYLDVNVLNQTVPTLFELLFGQSFKQDMWEKSFSDIADFEDPGYIGILQKGLAANADCLILVGGGTFQGSAEMLYNNLHPGSKCVLKLC